MSQSLARQDAIDEALTELVKQLAGTEVSSLSRSDQKLTNDTLSEEFQVASFAKIKGRILDYEIIDIDQNSNGGLLYYRIALKGRVCADDLVEAPLVIALHNPSVLPPEILDELHSALSRSLAVNPRLTLSDKKTGSGFSDIDIEISLESPRSRIVDRSATIKALQSSLGADGAEGISRWATQVLLRFTLRATIHEDGTALVASHVVERELPGKQARLSQGLISEMQSEGAKVTSREITNTLSTHVEKSGI